MLIRYRRDTGHQILQVGLPGLLARGGSGGCRHMRAAGDYQYNGCGDAVYLQRHSLYHRSPCLGFST